MSTRLLPPLLPPNDLPSLWIVLYAARRLPTGLPTHIDPAHRIHNTADEPFNWAFVIGTHTNIEERTGIRYSIWQLPAEGPNQKYWEWFLESKKENEYVKDTPSYGAIGPPLVRLRVAEVRNWAGLQRHFAPDEYVTFFENTSTSKRWVQNMFESLRRPVPKRKCFTRVTGKLWKEIESYCVQYAEQEAEARVRRKEAGWKKFFFRWSGGLPVWDLVEEGGEVVEEGVEGLDGDTEVESSSSEGDEVEEGMDGDEEVAKRVSEGAEEEAGEVMRVDCAVLGERANGS